MAPPPGDPIGSIEPQDSSTDAAVVAPSEDEEATEDPLAEEQRLGQSEHGTAVNEALRSLSRAARSFLIYDTHNEAIRAFLGSYKADMEAALALGPVDLEIRPFEMVLDEEVVYLERDRGRSLAFRLFRDGVRRLTVQPEVAWEELLRLLQILSIRYTGIRQHEDDVVTLLWKAGFQHIELVAVEGFVADEDEQGDSRSRWKARKERAAAHGAQIEVPGDWDLPAPELPVLGPSLSAIPLDEQVVSGLRGELASMNLPGHALGLVRRMLEHAGDPTQYVALADVAPLVGEIRDFFLSEGQLGRLLELVRLVGAHRSLDEEWAIAQIRRSTDARALSRVLRSLPKGIQAAPEELIELLGESREDPVVVVIEALGQESTPRMRRVGRSLLSHVVLQRLDVVREQLEVVPPETAAVLFTSVVEADAAEALGLVREVLLRKDRELELELYRFAKLPAAAPKRAELRRALVRSSAMQVRLDVISELVAERDQQSGALFLERLEHEGERLVEQEAVALGEGLVALGGDKVLARMASWVKPKGLRDMVGGVTLAGRMRQYAGVAGLGLSDREEAEAVIRWLSKRVDKDLHAHCMRTVVKMRRRRAGMSHG